MYIERTSGIILTKVLRKFITGLALILLASTGEAAKPAALIKLDGVIDPVLVRYVQRAYQKAEKTGAQCVILEINTPGGLEISMREIIQEILNSPLPTIAYVSPKGGRAASAGAFIVLACNLSAMAPNTTIGAAHPVAGEGKDIPGNLDKKITNDAAAFIRSLAAERGRDVKWAEDAVRKSVSLNGVEAVKQRIIDCVAEDRTDLLKKMNGKTVTVGGKKSVLDLTGAEVVPIEITTRERFFHTIAHPEIAYILLMLGTVGLIFEFQSGLGIGAVLGTICLVLGMISLSILPFNVGGLLIILLGLGLMIAELKFATHGILTAAGIACLLFGSIMLFSPLEPFWKVSRVVIFSTVGMMAVVFAGITLLGIAAQRAPKASGMETLPGMHGNTVTDLDPSGIVRVAGEEWSALVAEGAHKIRKGEGIIVKSVEGLKLVVEPAEASATWPSNKGRKQA